MSERTVVAGVGSLEADRAVLSWAADEAWRAEKGLYLVHCYRRLISTDRYWPPLAQANDARHDAAQHVVSSAVATARAQHHDLLVDGSSVAAPACATLIDLSRVAELLVVGRHCATPADSVRAIAAASSCPVVFVGTEPVDSGPVVLFLDSDDLFVPAVDVAFEAAARRGCDLLVAQAFPATPGEQRSYEVAAMTERQEQLDESLARWQRRYPGVGVTVELREEPPADTLRWAGAQGRLLVLPRRCADSIAQLECGPRQGPVIVVPPPSRRRGQDAGIAPAPAQLPVPA